MICKIDRVTDRTDHPVKPHNYLTGRTGRLVELDEGYPLVIDFGGTSLVTSPVADIRQSRRVRSGCRPGGPCTGCAGHKKSRTRDQQSRVRQGRKNESTLIMGEGGRFVNG
jgi:hypothetical protein